MKKLYIFLVALVGMTAANAQPCLPEGITFTTQEQIDNFPINYPDCNEIEGDVNIGQWWPISDITNLDSLIVLNSIGGDLSFIYNPDLISVSGLSNLTSIGGSLWIIHNSSITSLSGLDNLSYIGGYLWVENNSELASLTGLENLETIVGYLKIRQNVALTSLTGLQNISFVGENLEILLNNSLINLAGLDNLISLGGAIKIEGNESLVSLNGLDALDAGSITDLYIHDNLSLSDCETVSVCNYLASPNGTVNIYNNVSGCNNPTEVSNACGNTFSCLPFGNYYFVSQCEIDNFQVNYPMCTDLLGMVMISGDDIVNLNGLNTISSIEGNLTIKNNDSLPGLTGLENLAFVGGVLEIFDNDALLSLIGFESLDTIININISDNDLLTNLTGLENLICVSNSLKIVSNSSMINLSGIDNLNYLRSIHAGENPSLTSLSGLENVSAIEDYVSILGNNALQNLMGLNNLQFIGGGLSIGSSGGYGNSSLQTLTGLESLKYIGGGLGIKNNDLLIDLQGLENLDSIGGSLNIWGNESLQNLAGIVNLISVGGNLQIGDDWELVGGNPSLLSITGLQNLTSIGGYLKIEENQVLESLSGLENVDAGSISELYIGYNSNLSVCEVQSICEFLASPNGTIEIHCNAPGCNSQEEVIEACEAISVDELHLLEKIVINPNPFNDATTITFELTHPEKTEIKIFNQTGQLLKEFSDGNAREGINKVTWQANGLPPGIYYIQVQYGIISLNNKAIKLN